MKGIIFNLVERVVTDAHGEDVWDDLLEAAGVDGAYTSLGSYPDDRFDAIVAAGAARIGLPPGDVLRWAARGALPLTAQAYPLVFSPHTATRPFLLTLNEIIHPEVLKLYPGAYTPSFSYGEDEEGTLVPG